MTCKRPCCDHFNRFMDALGSVQTATSGWDMRDVPEVIRLMVEQQVREADSRKRSAIAKAVWARRKANLRHASQTHQD